MINYERLARVFLADLTSIRVAVSIVAFFLGIGFATANVNNENYTLLTNFAPVQVWSFAFIVYAVATYVHASYPTPPISKAITGTIGLFMWTYLFLSFVVFDTTPVYSTELMLAGPIVVETWLIAEALFKRS